MGATIPPMLVILFGLPGSGKSFVGKVLQSDFDFWFHEADDDIPDEYRQQVLAGQVVGEPMRDDYHRHLIDRMTELQPAHPRLAVAAPLLRDRHRLWIRARFPQTLFILVQCRPDTWQTRLQARTHTISLDYARKVASLNEPATVPYAVLDDSADGADSIHRQFAAIMANQGTGAP